MRYRVGSVPYLNAKPLVKPLEWRGGESPVEVVYAVPSKLPALLSQGSVQAIMVSSIHALTEPGSRVAAGLSISSQDEVLSVRLFSKVPLDRIETLALDASSMTSSALARIVLAERFGVRPAFSALSPGLDSMLERHDACVMIGDNGMGAEPNLLEVLDLGSAWRAMTGLPFVWALWVGDEGLTPELAGHLGEALRESRSDWSRVIDAADRETGFTPEQCRHYLLDIMDYDLEDGHLEGLREFGRLAVRQGIIGESQMPQIVQPMHAIAR